MKRLTFLIGHRGTGKSHFLSSLAADADFKNHRLIDLDAEIEKEAGPIAGIFADQGEEAFRKIELATLDRALAGLAGAPAVVALGAGFRLTEWRAQPTARSLANDSEWVWLRRVSDERGRIFLDRPRLEVGLSPLDEFTLRFQAREPIYRDVADFILDLPEGMSTSSGVDMRELFKTAEARPFNLGGSAIYTLTAGCRRHAETLLPRLQHGGFAAIELRSDLLSADDFLFWRAKLPVAKQLLSFRGRGFPGPVDGASAFGLDWALEEGRPQIPCSIVSLHHGSDPREFAAFEGTKHLKWAPLVESFPDLVRGFEWQQADPDNRSFLPRSTDGRWPWFRLFMKGRQRLNFVRIGEEGPVKDQPSLIEWHRALSSAEFAAVLGDPVWQSFTPTEQGPYFSARGLSTFKIQIRENEWSQAFPALETLGLRAAAVTSPLKKCAAQSPGHRSPKVAELGAANTLVRSHDDWRSENTDEAGLEEAAAQLRNLGPTLVWGGGGTLALLRRLWPEAFFYSVRSGAPREGLASIETSPRLLIWAAGPRDPAPPFEVHPEVVLDLNYREDSGARELSIRTGARYISGLAFFRAQARLQREFWDKYL